MINPEAKNARPENFISRAVSRGKEFINKTKMELMAWDVAASAAYVMPWEKIAEAYEKLGIATAYVTTFEILDKPKMLTQDELIVGLLNHASNEELFAMITQASTRDINIFKKLSGYSAALYLARNLKAFLETMPVAEIKSLLNNPLFVSQLNEDIILALELELKSRESAPKKPAMKKRKKLA